MTGSNSHITVITLNANGLNVTIKRHRLANWIKSHDPLVCCIQETHLTCKDTHRLKIKGWKKVLHANRNQKKNRSSYNYIRHNGFQDKNYEKRKGHYTMIMGLMQRRR